MKGPLSEEIRPLMNPTSFFRRNCLSDPMGVWFFEQDHAQKSWRVGSPLRGCRGSRMEAFQSSDLQNPPRTFATAIRMHWRRLLNEMVRNQEVLQLLLLTSVALTRAQSGVWHPGHHDSDTTATICLKPHHLLSSLLERETSQSSIRI